MTGTGALPRGSVLGTRLTVSDFETAVRFLADAVAADRPVVMSPATVYSVMLGYERPAYRTMVNQASYVMADGTPLVWALRLLGFQAEQVDGDRLMLTTCARFPERRHFLLGGALGQPERVAGELRRRCAGLQIVGTYATPERPLPATENDRIVAAILSARAQIVWVGMGTPAQDEWMTANTARIGASLVGVGSVFDLLTGSKRRAPLWLQRMGCEWLYRLTQDPRRLAYRYLRYNPLFIWHFIGQWMGLRTY